MRIRYIQNFAFLIILFLAASSCNGNSKKVDIPVVYKGLYSFGPEIKSFKDCDNGTEFWVADSSATLELQYSQMNFEKPYEPVYVEVEGIKSKSGKEGMGSEYDSTLVVKKVIKITKEIPQDMCN
jgi:copper homeostasis protein (lipoprotein)